MNFKAVAVVAAFAFTLAACEQGRENEQAGTLVGAAAGAVLGSQIGSGLGRTVTTIAGSVAGGYIGGQIGKSLDARDRQMLQTTTQSALETGPTGQTRKWNNPDSGHSGSITPQQPYKSAEGEDCREYQETVNAAGETQTGYRSACRQTDGTWRIVSN